MRECDTSWGVSCNPDVNQKRCWFLICVVCNCVILCKFSWVLGKVWLSWVACDPNKTQEHILVSLASMFCKIVVYLSSVYWYIVHIPTHNHISKCHKLEPMGTNERQKILHDRCWWYSRILYRKLNQEDQYKNHKINKMFAAMCDFKSDCTMVQVINQALNTF